MPPEPRRPIDQDHAEEIVHQWLIGQGITDRQTLWAATLKSRAVVWVVALRRAGRSDRASEALLQAATLELRRRMLRHQCADPTLRPDERADVIWRHNLIDYDHLSYELTRPPVGWMES